MTNFQRLRFHLGLHRNKFQMQIQKLAESIHGIPSLGDVATDRRLHVESCTHVLNDMKASSLNADSWEPMKKLPFVEKQTRFETQKSKKIINQKQGSLKAATARSMSNADTPMELRLLFALQCIHLAFEIVHSSTWQQGQVWLDKVMGSLIQEPLQVASSLGLTQIFKTDEEIFSPTASEYSSSLVADTGKAPPLDEVFTCLMHDPRVNVHALQCPAFTC